MPMRIDNDAEVMLVLRCQAGDKAALDELLQNNQGRLWRYILKLASDPVLADDILQEVFLLIYRKIGWLDDPKLFQPWAYRIASRETFRILKKRRPWDRPGEDEYTESEPALEPDQGDDRELKLKLNTMLAKLSPASRAVLVLHYLEGMSLSETATILGISPGTAKSRLSYGLACLRRRIKETSHDR